MIAPAPALVDGDTIRLDRKFASGMTTQAQLFAGQFDCLLRAFDGPVPFSTETYDSMTHPFGLSVLDAAAPITAAHLAGYDLILCSADDDQNLSLTQLLQDRPGKTVAVLEYTLQTRRQINALEQRRNPLRRFVRDVKLRLREPKRMALLRSMDALQANGYPAYDVCRAVQDDTLLYLDNRMTAAMYASSQEVSARITRMESNAPLALVFSGRLERSKGAHDLVPIAALLAKQDVPFTLDLYGEGSLAGEIARQIAEAGLEEQVQLHGSVDFETALVPQLRKQADVFLCCHRQADPSCTYIETMACGVPIIGFGNAMWRDLQGQSSSGWVVPMGDQQAMAATLARLHNDRAALTQATQRAIDFARNHDFDEMSKHRMDHLMAVAVR